MQPAEHRVYQHNRLVEASHTLTLNEKRLVLLAASKLDSRKPLPSDGYIRISAAEYADVFGININTVYRMLSEAAHRLYARTIRLYRDDGRVAEEMRWVFHVIYREGQAQVELGFSPSVTPYLTRLHREFTHYQLQQVGSLTSFHAIRLYELCCQFLRVGSRQVPLDRLRQMLDVVDKYKSVKDLRRHVLDASIREINEHTNLTVSVEPKRKGRRIVAFTFSIRQKCDAVGSNESQAALDL